MKVIFLALKEVKDAGQRVMETFILYAELSLALVSLFCFIEIVLSAIDKFK